MPKINFIECVSVLGAGGQNTRMVPGTIWNLGIGSPQSEIVLKLFDSRQGMLRRNVLQLSS